MLRNISIFIIYEKYLKLYLSIFLKTINLFINYPVLSIKIAVIKINSIYTYTKQMNNVPKLNYASINKHLL